MDDEFLPPPDPAELGLPDELPPIRVLDLTTLAQQARASAFLARVHQVATWLDGREVVVEDYLLSESDATVGAGALGCSPNEFELLWSLAKELEFVEVTDDEARQGEGLGDWPDGSDEAVVECGTWPSSSYSPSRCGTTATSIRRPIPISARSAPP